eukprot:CAMPEP_0119078272 /NCGR_PEP_ID=MMETSP1178-20130426/99470_1 /TAXON_ID=33656 /ORGANISM="unid sp, Strain CCMP2000" /LENGTH=101 /DNA_ID=CAMNT_0007060705 /DNA_START=1 /DNA_END=303 /DNA_ORIENTATION=+
MGYDHNYCRNPWARETGDIGAWCYTQDKGTLWDFCDVGTPSSTPCPHTPTPDSGEWAQCEETCAYAGDGQCDDGGPGAAGSSCTIGSDCADCGIRNLPPSP